MKVKLEEKFSDRRSTGLQTTARQDLVSNSSKTERKKGVGWVSPRPNF
jgi:hypothetical protein